MTPEDSCASTLTTADGTTLFVRDWPCNSKPEQGCDNPALFTQELPSEWRNFRSVAGEEDRLVDANESKVFHSNLASGIGTLHYYPGYYHELFNEENAGQVFDDMRAWLAAC